jgi:PKD repeat protein
MKNIYILFSICLLTTTVKAQIPVLNSKPSSQNVIYLDFDGEVVNNPNWYASTINAAPSGLTNDQIVETFKRITEKYIPFDVNITTSLAVYNAALATKRQQVVVTPTSQWYGSAGGVAFVGSFGWAAYSPAWVFPNNLSNNADFIATAAAHEVGHTLLLNHHAPYDASCNRIGFYHQGKGTGQTSWGPIMGAPYYSNFVVWYKGSTTSPTCAQTNQDDLALITSFIPYRNDDHGNTIAAATTLNIVSNAFADSGIIERNTDADFFKFTLTQSSNVTVNARPWSLNPATNTAACLDTKVELFNNSGMLLVADSSITTLNSSITQNNLSAGTYYVKIDGTGIANYNDYGGTGPNDYGSLGRFYINAIITPNGGGPTPPVANFNTSVNTICTGQSILCSDISSNTPTSWSWTCTGATPSTSTSQNPTFTFLAAGTYNISLTATNSGGSNTYTKQVTVNPNPVITATNQTMCSGSTISISATGASTYSWMPATGPIRLPVPALMVVWQRKRLPLPLTPHLTSHQITPQSVTDKVLR